MKKIFEFKQGEKWYKGSFTVNYNLKWWLLPFILLWMLIYGIWLGISWLLEKIWDGLCWLGKHLWALVLLLLPFLGKFWNWLKSLFARKPRPAKPATETKQRNWNWILWLLAAILLLLLLLLCLKNCGGKEEETEPEAIETVYDASWDDVVIAQCYLNGVQETVNAQSRIPLALVGFKFIDGKSVKDYSWTGETYDEALKVVSNSWKPLVIENVHTPLTKQQMTVVVLTAMRMGDSGFKRSTFLQKINEGNLAEAGNWLLLQKKDGSIREVGKEPRQYFNVLRMLWNNEITVAELSDCSYLSYKRLDPDTAYTLERQLEVIKRPGLTPTPKKALGLE